MKDNNFVRLIFPLLIALILQGYSQDKVTIVAPASEAAEDLDLHAVAELFKDSPNLEEFEKALNDSETGINNLDLDDNGQVDFIRVVEEVSGETHVIILQALLGDNEVQDVATIEVEKSGDDYNMQVTGDEIIYGPHYYIIPRPVRIYHWGILGWMYRPVYHPYRSVYRYGYYPKWHRYYKPVPHKVYRTHTVKYVNRNGFTVTKTRKVHVTKVNHKRSSSKVVKTRTVERRPGKTTVTKTTTVKRKKRD